MRFGVGVWGLGLGLGFGDRVWDWGLLGSPRTIKHEYIFTFRVRRERGRESIYRERGQRERARERGEAHEIVLRLQSLIRVLIAEER